MDEPLELPHGARAALLAARARRLSYAVRALRAPDGRAVVLLGEAHLKFARAAALGRAVVAAFDLRGVESFQSEKVAWGRALMFVVEAPRRALKWLFRGRLYDSTIVDARGLKAGTTYLLEGHSRTPLALHVGSVYLTLFFTLLPFAPMVAALPRQLGSVRDALQLVIRVLVLHMPLLPVAVALRRHRWSWLIHPLSAILVVRDEIMVEGALSMLAEHPEPESAVLVMGRAHCRGVEALLIRDHGFTRATL